MNGWFLFAAVISLLITIAHSYLGERTTVQTLLVSEIDTFPKLELNLVWHLLTIQFALYTGALLWLSFAQPIFSTTIAKFVAANFALYAIYFVVPIASGRSTIKQLPQSIIMFLMATLIFIGAA